jgi:biopolymer transport protein ExbD
MADIAFLLLIFFLVTTTIETDSGITRKLPPIDDEQEDPPILKERNIFVVLVNSNGDLFVEDEIMEFKNLRQATIEFLDNGGGLGDEACNYCQGPKNTSSSDNPIKAVVSLQNDRKTQYGRYIAVQNELVAAYNVLRDREANRLYNIDFTEMEDAYNDPEFQGDKEKLKDKINVIKNLFPQKLSEAEPI